MTKLALVDREAPTPSAARTAEPTPPEPTHRRAIRRRVSPSVWVGLLAGALYLYPAATVLQLAADEVEYIDVARRLLAGDGFRLGIKAYHFGGPEVLQDGLTIRPPLLPLLIAGLLGLGLPLASIQVLNALFAGVSVGLLAAIATRVFDARVGVGAGVLAATSPIMLERMVTPMTEPLAVCLTLAAVWLVLRAGDSPRAGGYALAGLALGLGYLARPTVLALAAALIVGLLAFGRRRTALLAPLGALVLGLAVVVAPISLYSLLTRGSLSYSGQTYLYSVRQDSEVLQEATGRTALPHPVAFIRDNAGFVVRTIGDHAVLYARLLLLDRDWLLPLLPAWAVVLVALARRRLPRASGVLLALAGANFALFAVTWASFLPRYMLLTMLFLLPVAVAGLDRGLDLAREYLAARGVSAERAFGRESAGPSGEWWACAALFALVAAIALFWAPAFARAYSGQFVADGQVVGTRVDRGVRWTGPSEWVDDPGLAQALDWIDARTAPGSILAAGEPWPLTFFTGRPSTLLPRRLSAEQLRSFIADYRVEYVALDGRDRPRRAYRDYLDEWQPEGVARTTVGSYRFYDVRALWRP